MIISPLSTTSTSVHCYAGGVVHVLDVNKLGLLSSDGTCNSAAIMQKVAQNERRAGEESRKQAAGQYVYTQEGHR